ncbi:alpha/beta hydrolase, partial [Escherichia coli]|uniref:alpha/beta fold hydrolase n=1 Tax=Escherichia coli TaxID=562 RepID=UPI0021155D0D
VEFLSVIPLLTQAGFDVVVPSLPGYGWSGRPPAPIGPASVARMWRKLMTEALGYKRFFAQGGDWGSAVTYQLGATHADV